VLEFCPPPEEKGMAFRLAPLADPYLDRDLVEFGVILRDLDPGVHDDRQYRSRVRSLCELSRDIYLLLVPVECSPAEKVADAVKLFKQAVEGIRTSRLDSDTRRYRDNIADRAKELAKPAYLRFLRPRSEL
jgi:hypothetical protein